MKLTEISPHLIYEFKNESELLRAIEELSRKFTTERGKIGDYLKDPRLVSAYTAFYFLTNFPKLTEVLKWMPADWISILKNCAFIDMGAGPGTFSLAWKEFIGQEGEFFQIEISSLMREQAKKLWESLHKDPLIQGDKWLWKPAKPKFLFFGHSANEMGSDLVIKYIEEISPEHILFVEPGTKDFFKDMLRIRDYLFSEKYNVLYPCPKALTCPMKNTEDWCHQFIQVKQDLEVERLSQMVKKDRKLLPLTVHAYSKTFSHSNESERVVRVHPETKFSFEWDICHDNNLEHYQVMKRGLSKTEIKDLEGILSGAAVKTEIEKELEKSKRVRILSTKK